MLRIGNRWLPVIVVKTNDQARLEALVDKIIAANKGRSGSFVPYEDDEILIATPLSQETEFVTASGLGGRTTATYFVYEGGTQVERRSACFTQGIAVSSTFTEAVRLALFNRGVFDRRGVGRKLAEFNSRMSALMAEAERQLIVPAKVWDLDGGNVLCSPDAAALIPTVTKVDDRVVSALSSVCGFDIKTALPPQLSHMMHVSAADTSWRVTDDEAARITAAGRRLIGMPVHLMMAMARGNEQADFVTLYGRIAGITEALVSKTDSSPVMSVADLFMDARDSMAEILGRNVQDPRFALEVNRGNVELTYVSGQEDLVRHLYAGQGVAQYNVDSGIIDFSFEGATCSLRVESDTAIPVPQDIIASMADVREYLGIVYALYAGFSVKNPYIRVSPNTLNWLNVNLGRAGGLFFP